MVEIGSRSEAGLLAFFTLTLAMEYFADGHSLLGAFGLLGALLWLVICIARCIAKRRRS